jgi:sugar phosphate isomerase/epimerase
MLTFIFVGAAVAMELVLGLGIVLLFFHRFPGDRSLRAVLIPPMVVAPVVAGLLSRYMLNVQSGVVNFLTESMGLSRIDFLGDPAWPLVCGAFGPDRDVSSDDPMLRESGKRYIGQCVDIAAALGAPMVAGPMHSATGKVALVSPEKRRQQWAWATENLRAAAGYAASRGIGLAIEPLNRFETGLVNTVEQGVEPVTRIGRGNAGLLLDTLYMNIEEHSVPDALRRAGKHVFHFHARANDRGIPGQDHLPWAEIELALAGIGYGGPWVIEAARVRSNMCPMPSAAR